MRAARPGMLEYQLQAESEHEFTRGGAYGPAYFALVATGKNTWYTHYHYNTTTLAAGDLVQYDYAPDYKYYASDVTRLFPANGRFTPYQREYYGLYLKLYRALLASMRVHERPETIRARALAAMEGIVAKHKFSTPALQAAFATFLDQFRRPGNGWLGHAVGMEVHDVYGDYQTLEPGMVFTIEPQLRLPDDHVGVRLEDMILVTPQGVEVMSGDLPLDADAIERFMATPLPQELR
jgi:Xaa-Pro aminopeptidase